MRDLFSQWLDALEKRHLASLTFQEVRRSVQALSSLYVERRDRLAQGSALDGAGKRAAFACYFSPLHFLLVREIVRNLKTGMTPVSQVVDIGCGTGIAGAAWALEMVPTPRVVGIDRNSWALGEAKWNCSQFQLNAAFKNQDIESFRIPRDSAIVGAFAINELTEPARHRALKAVISAARHGSPALIVEPIARRSALWWPEWTEAFRGAGGRADEWRFQIELPEKLALMDKSAGLDHRELTGRSLWLPGGDGQSCSQPRSL